MPEAEVDSAEAVVLVVEEAWGEDSEPVVDSELVEAQAVVVDLVEAVVGVLAEVGAVELVGAPGLVGERGSVAEEVTRTHFTCVCNTKSDLHLLGNKTIKAEREV